MKKATILFAMAGLLLASSCTRIELFPSDPREWNGTKATLKLAVKSADSPKTKAETTRPGDDDGNYNENKIYTLDYFIFNVDPTANSNSGTDAVIKGRLSFNGIEPTTEELALEYAKTIDVSEKFGENNNTCYVYVIANLPDATSSPDNYFEINEDGDLQHVAGTTTTVLEADYATLQAIEVLTDFKNSLTEGKKFKAQKSFVMSGLKGPITLSGTGADEAIVDVSRIASKISLDINVIKMIEQYSTQNTSQAEVYQGTWFPNVDHIQIYLNYVNPAGLVSGTYEGRKYEIGSYFSYERNAYIPSIKSDGTYTSTSLARYNNDPSSPYYCGEGNEDLVGSIYVDGSGNPVLINGTQYPAFEVTGTPFYSYPTIWKTSDATAPFIKIIIPWVKYSVVESYRNLSPDSQAYKNLINAVQGFPTETTNLTYTLNETVYPVATRVTTASAMTSRYGEEFYYKISVPAFLENPYVDSQTNETYECALFANKWYMINLDVAVLGSETDDAEMTIDGSQMGIYVVDWSTPDEELGGDLDGGRYLSTAKKEYTFNAAPSLTIPVISSHSLSITGYGGTGNPTAKYWTRRGGADAGSLNYSTNGSSTGTNFSITATGNSSVTLAHTIVPFSTSFTETANAKDIAMITYKFRIQHSDNANYYEDIIVYQYPSIYVETKSSSGSPFIYRINNGTIVGQSNGSSSNNNNVSVGQISRNGQGDLNFTIVSISSLAGLSSTYPDWVIGDPRIKLGDAYTTPSSGQPYYIDNHPSGNNDNTRWYRNDLGLAQDYFDNYLVSDKNANNFIAPRFMLASGYGYNGDANNGNWKRNSERCASYQEDGYPAGRWRVPTEAELLFCATLAAKQLIPSPFVATTYYSAASGLYLYYNTSNNTFTGSLVERTSGLRSVRCVYDLWYWGDEPEVTPGAYSIRFSE